MIRHQLLALALAGSLAVGLQPGVTRATVVHADSPDFNLDAVSAVEQPAGRPPLRAAICAINPNPFNPTTTIGFELASTAPFELAVYDLQGRRLAVLDAGIAQAGRREATWDGLDEAGLRLPSGTYVCRLRQGGDVQSRKLLLVK